MFNKSKDYLVQTSPIDIWYMRKPGEGDALFNTASVSTFKGGARVVHYALMSQVQRQAPEFKQNETVQFHVWRTPWLAAGFTDMPCVSDKVFAGSFWLVSEVEYCDMDDSGDYQRYVLHCTGSNKDLQA